MTKFMSKNKNLLITFLFLLSLGQSAQAGVESILSPFAVASAKDWRAFGKVSAAGAVICLAAAIICKIMGDRTKARE